MGELEKALADYGASIALAPSFENTYDYRRYVRYQLGDRVGALADASLAWQLAPEKEEFKEVHQWAVMLRMELDNEKRPAKIVATRPTTAAFIMRPASAIRIEEMFQAPRGTKPYGEQPGLYVIDPRAGMPRG